MSIISSVISILLYIPFKEFLVQILGKAVVLKLEFVCFYFYAENIYLFFLRVLLLLPET